jgi:hypothetical protein
MYTNFLGNLSGCTQGHMYVKTNHSVLYHTKTTSGGIVEREHYWQPSQVTGVELGYSCNWLSPLPKHFITPLMGTVNKCRNLKERHQVGLLMTARELQSN